MLFEKDFIVVTAAASGRIRSAYTGTEVPHNFDNVDRSAFGTRLDIISNRNDPPVSSRDNDDKKVRKED